jgi:hypothetical protein
MGLVALTTVADLGQWCPAPDRVAFSDHYASRAQVGHQDPGALTFDDHMVPLDRVPRSFPNRHVGRSVERPNDGSVTGRQDRGAEDGVVGGVGRCEPSGSGAPATDADQVDPVALASIRPEARIESGEVRIDDRRRPACRDEEGTALQRKRHVHRLSGGRTPARQRPACDTDQ